MCAGNKLEVTKASYRQMIKALERKSYSSSLTTGVVVLLVISVLLFIVATAAVFLQTNDQRLVPIFVIALGSGVLTLFGTSFWYLIKARNHMRDESIEYDLEHPGFYDYYQQWQAKVEEITLSSSQY